MARVSKTVGKKAEAKVRKVRPARGRKVTEKKRGISFKRRKGRSVADKNPVMTDGTQPGGTGPATGAVAANFHEGSRSEILADYLFSAWGTVTPVRRQSDFGLDLYCTLTERIGQLARVREYYSVQVKSGDIASWLFNDSDSVKWLVQHPLPLFLCAVDKKRGLVRVYHSIPRFQIWA